jgi:Right handed beta helix region/Protein of unknown function (DUF1565)
MKCLVYPLSLLLISLCAPATEVSLTPPVFLPDGQEFKTWEPSLEFTRTYHVDQRNALASDRNPGTEQLPFRTIGRAAELLQPGERVVVAAGVYREHVAPTRGGSGPDRMISYEAAPGAEVIIKGSELASGGWQKATGWDGFDKPGAAKIWRLPLGPEWFTGYNPFANINLPRLAAQDCFNLNPKLVPRLVAKRGLLFQNGRLLRQVVKPQDLLEEAGTYWAEWNGEAIYMRPFDDVAPETARFEITTREQAFAPRDYELGYIRVKGFTIEQVADGFPWPQRAALSTMRGHHWIIEENTIRWVNALGMDIGRSEVDMEAPPIAGYHIVRRNLVEDCGVCGIAGTGPLRGTLIEENIITRCGWQKVEQYFECAGIKTHHNQSTLIRRNLLTDMIQASGIWMDWGNINSRCSENVVINTDSMFGGIFLEASQVPNMVDNNFVWGSTGHGIYQHDCDDLIIAHNFVGNAAKNGIFMNINQGREVMGRPSTSKRNRILNNMIWDCGTPITITDPENTSDFNLIGTSEKSFDLAAWQSKTGWDKNSAIVTLQPTFHPKTLTFSLKSGTPLPRFPRVPGVTVDMLGAPFKGDNVLPGAFAKEPDAPVSLGQKWK